MRISPLFRLTALWALLVFAAGWSEDALVLHPCPHHAAISHAAARHDGHGGAHHAAGSKQSDGHGSPSHSGPCSCIVACAGTAYVLASPRGEARLAAAEFRAAPALPARTATALPGRREYILPFPTAPPVLPS